MKIAMLGWIPATGDAPGAGAPELAAALEARGHELVVYRRSRFPQVLFGAVHAAWVGRPDIAVFFGVAHAPLCLIMRAAAIPTLMHLDPGEQRARTGSPLAGACRRLAARGAQHFASEAITEPLLSWRGHPSQYERLLEAVRTAGGPGRLPDYLLDLDPDPE